jgi:hypothetical protein
MVFLSVFQGRMFQVLWINSAIVNGSGDRACGFFSSSACFSEIDTGSLKYSPNMTAPAATPQLAAAPAHKSSGNSVKPMSLAWMSPAGVKSKVNASKTPSAVRS